MTAPIVASSSSNTLTGGTDLVITKPTGLAVGDLMIAFVTGNGTPTLAPPDGDWTAIGSAVTDGFSAHRSHAWRKVADADDVSASNFTFTRNASGDMAGGILRISGYDTTTPVNVSATGSATSGTSQTSPAVTTTVNDCLVLRMMSSDSSTVTIATAGVADLWNVAAPTARQAVGWENQATAGSTGTETWTFSSTNQMTAITVAIAPGEGGGTSPPIITSGDGDTATVFVDEGDTAVTTVTASGLPAPTFSVTGGANENDYSINSSTGELTRDSAIAYGAPEEVEVTATNTGGTDVQTITVVPNPMYTGPAPSAPLDDAAYFFRPLADHHASNTQYPNLGTRDEPLILGDDYTADAQDPDWGTDGGGGHLVYTNAGDSYCHAAAPQAVIDAASFTVACRITWTDSSTTGNLFNAIKDINTDAKTIFLHRQSDNTYEGRVWDGTTDAQVDVISSTLGTNGTTHDVVLTYDGTTRELLLYINGVEEDDNTASNPRRLRGSDYYLEWPVGVGLASPSLCPNCKYRRMAFWTRCLSPTEVANLGTHTLWATDGDESDETAPVLSSATTNVTGHATATVGATTDEANGTLYVVVTTSSSAPSAAQVKAGQDHTGAAAAFADDQAIASTGAKTFDATGLSAETGYYAHLMHEDAATNQSNVLTTDLFTTDPTPATQITITGPGTIPYGVEKTFYVNFDGDATGITVDLTTTGDGTYNPSQVVGSGSASIPVGYTANTFADSPHTLGSTDDGGLTNGTKVVTVLEEMPPSSAATMMVLGIV